MFNRHVGRVNPRQSLLLVALQLLPTPERPSLSRRFWQRFGSHAVYGGQRCWFLLTHFFLTRETWFFGDLYSFYSQQNFWSLHKRSDLFRRCLESPHLLLWQFWRSVPNTHRSFSRIYKSTTSMSLDCSHCSHPHFRLRTSLGSPKLRDFREPHLVWFC